jgi:hypothetical protein
MLRDAPHTSIFILMKHKAAFRLCLLLLILAGSGMRLSGQDTPSVPTTDTMAQEPPGSRKFKIVPFPVIAANPSSGFMYGLAPAAYWRMGNPANTSLSNLLSTILWTTKNQFLFTAKANTYFKGDQATMQTDIRYFDTSQPTYGLGTGPQSAKPISGNPIEYPDYPFRAIPDEQMMEFQFLRVYNTFMYRYKDTRFFLGLGYHLDIHQNIEDNLLDLDTMPPAVTSHYGYSLKYEFDPKGYTSSGVSLNLLWDSRDNTVNPYKGFYAYGQFKVNPTWLGSDQKSNVLWLEYRDYFPVIASRPRHLVGLWLYGWFVTNGSVPYLDLPALGWDQFGRSGRAYTQGRFRGQQLIYSEGEYRFPLQRNKERWGGVVFVNATTATNKDANIRLYDYLDVGYGVGLRWMFSEDTRANVNIDYAWGNYGAQGFYLGMNEVF